MKRPRSPSLELDEQDKEESREYLIASSGSQLIRSALSKASPLHVIESTQSSRGMKVLAAKSALPLLDLLGLRRNQVSSAVLELLVQRAVEKVKRSREGEVELLERFFKFIALEELRPIAVAILENSERIEPSFLDQMAQNPLVMDALPLKIKQQVWEAHPIVFKEFAEKIIHGVALDSSKTAKVCVFSGRESGALRFQNLVQPQLHELVESIGTSNLLYKQTCNAIRDIYEVTQNPLMSILRMELLMAMHDQQKEARDIVSSDPSYKYTWCLSACVSDGKVDKRRIDELSSIYMRIKNENSKEASLVADMSLVTAHPAVISMLTSEILNTLSEIVQNEEIPKDSETLKMLSSLLVLANLAYRIVKEKKNKFPKISGSSFKSFFPVIAEILLLMECNETDDLSFKLTESLSSCKTGVNSTVLSLLLLRCLQAGDEVRMDQLLPLLAQVSLTSTFQPGPSSWLHKFLVSMVSEIISLREKFIVDSQPSALFKICVEKCLVPLSQRSIVSFRELLRLLWSLSANSSPNFSNGRFLSRDSILFILDQVCGGSHLSVDDSSKAEKMDVDAESNVKEPDTVPGTFGMANTSVEDSSFKADLCESVAELMAKLASTLGKPVIAPKAIIPFLN